MTLFIRLSTIVTVALSLLTAPVVAQTVTAAELTQAVIQQEADAVAKARLQAERLRKLDPEGEDSFSSYWQTVVAPRYGLPGGGQSNAATLRRGPPDLYSVFSGAAAMEESLQLQALAGAGAPSVATIPLSELSGPAVKSHPFREMLAGRTPALPTLAAWIPADQYAVFFSDMGKEQQLAELMEEWGGSLLRQVEPGGQDFRIREKLSRQLCLEESWLSRMFGDRVVGEMAFTGSDPFVKEGTGFTVIMSLKDPAEFRKQMTRRHKAAKSLGAELGSFTLGDVTVKTAVSPDRRISSYVAVTKGMAVVSTSRAALERVLATGGGRVPSLAVSDDFRYMRTIFPQDDAGEDIFVYLSDPHIRALTGPRAKIGEARRLRCSGNLTLMNNARLWFRAENGREPTMEELTRGGYLGEHPPVCPDGGHYGIDMGEARCSVHNRPGWLTPVDEVSLTAVTPEEAKEYRGFVENYGRYWSRFFDPIGIRVKMGETVRVETCILPLVENSWYDGLLAFTGGTSGPLSSVEVLPRTVFSLRSRLSPGLLRTARELQRGGLSLEWLGDDISLNLCDGPVLFTAGDRAMGLVGGGLGRSSSVEPLVFGYLVSALNLPTYLTVGVTDPQRAEKELPQLLQALGPRHHGRDFWLENYALEPCRGHDVQVATLNLWVLRFRLYAAVVGERLVIASRRDIVTELLDAAATDSPRSAAEQGSAQMTLYRGAFRQLEETAGVALQEDLRRSCLHNLPLLGIMGQLLAVQPEDAGKETFHLRGYVPTCPAGGRYLNGVDGLPECSVHGSLAHPRQPPDSAAPAAALAKSLERLSATLRFTPEGLMTTVEIRRK